MNCLQPAQRAYNPQLFHVVKDYILNETFGAMNFQKPWTHLDPLLIKVVLYRYCNNNFVQHTIIVLTTWTFVSCYTDPSETGWGTLLSGCLTAPKTLPGVLIISLTRLTHSLIPVSIKYMSSPLWMVNITDFSWTEIQGTWLLQSPGTLDLLLYSLISIRQTRTYHVSG